MSDVIAPDPKSPTPVRKRWLHWALAASLGLNLAVAGVVIGAVARHGGMAHRGEMVRDPGFGPFTEALNPQQRAALREAFMAQAPQMRTARRQMRQEMVAVLAALRAEPFDPARLAALLKQQNTRMADRLALGQSLLGAFLADLDPAARLAFAVRLEERLARRRGAAGDADP